MLIDAIAKLEKEMEEKKENTYIQCVGKYMVDYLNEHPDHAEKILADDRTLEGSMKHMRSVASKKKVGNVAVLTPVEGFKTVLEYYKIKDEVPQSEGSSKPKRKVDISLDDLF